MATAASRSWRTSQVAVAGFGSIRTSTSQGSVSFAVVWQAAAEKATKSRIVSAENLFIDLFPVFQDPYAVGLEGGEHGRAAVMPALEIGAAERDAAGQQERQRAARRGAEEHPHPGGEFHHFEAGVKST